MCVRIVFKHPVALALLLFGLTPAALAAPHVVVSLKPVELLVRAVATEGTTVTTLVPPGANPHSYSLKPSQRRALGEADAIFWIGPEMETFLTRLLNGEEFRHRSLALSSNAGPEEAPESHGNAHHHDDHGHDGHGHDTDNDPHVWLDPAIALDMARSIHQRLSQLEGADTQALEANLNRFKRALDQAEAQIREQLEVAKPVSLFTYHNAFSHFAEHYGLGIAGVLTLNPELSPGARHIAEVQSRLRNANRPCLMTEAPFDASSWDAIVGDVNVNFSTWDPLATDIAPGPEAYVTFQRSMADAVLACRQN